MIVLRGRDQLGEDTTSSLNTEGERVEIDENSIGSSFSTREDTTLNGGTIGNSFIKVDTLWRFLVTEELLKKLLGF